MRERSSRMEGAERLGSGTPRLLADAGPLVEDRNGARGERECGSFDDAVVACAHVGLAWIFTFVATCGRQLVCGFTARLRRADLPASDRGSAKACGYHAFRAGFVA